MSGFEWFMLGFFAGDVATTLVIVWWLLNVHGDGR